LGKKLHHRKPEQAQERQRRPGPPEDAESDRGCADVSRQLTTCGRGKPNWVGATEGRHKDFDSAEMHHEDDAGQRERLLQKATLRSSGTNCRARGPRQEGQRERVQQELARPKRILYFRRSAWPSFTLARFLILSFLDRRASEALPPMEQPAV